MIEYSETYLGRLLVRMGWIVEEDLERLIVLARQLDQPLGRILVDYGWLGSQELQNLLQAQALVRDGHVLPDVATRALNLASWSGAGLEDTLLWTGPGDADAEFDYSNRLGQMLIASGSLQRSVVGEALETCRQTGFPLGRLLVGRGQVPENVLTTTLEAQKLVRSDLVSLKQAVTSLRVVRLGLNRQELEKNSVIPLGQLVMHAGLVSPNDIEDAVEVSSINGQPIGQVLLIFALLSESLLNAALELQNWIRTGRLGRRAAVRALSLVFTENLPLKDAIIAVQANEDDESSLSVSSFLQLTGLFEGCLREIRYVEFTTARSRDQLPKLSNLVDDRSLRSAVRCTFLLRHSVLTLEQALLAFHYSLLNGSDIDDFLMEAGWITRCNLAKLSRQKPQERRLKVVSAA